MFLKLGSNHLKLSSILNKAIENIIGRLTIKKSFCPKYVYDLLNICLLFKFYRIQQKYQLKNRNEF